MIMDRLGTGLCQSHFVFCLLLHEYRNMITRLLHTKDQETCCPFFSTFLFTIFCRHPPQARNCKISSNAIPLLSTFFKVHDRNQPLKILMLPNPATLVSTGQQKEIISPPPIISNGRSKYKKNFSGKRFHQIKTVGT